MHRNVAMELQSLLNFQNFQKAETYSNYKIQIFSLVILDVIQSKMKSFSFRYEFAHIATYSC